MWTIKEAADRAGLKPDVLRAWERRYGVVHPTRTPSGYRLYSESDIRLLEAMQRLIEDGFRPREAADFLAQDPGAAGAVRAGADDAPAEARDMELRSLDAPSTDGHAASPPQLIAAAADLDVAALGAYFDRLSARGGFETVCDEVLFPALRDLGAAWAAGTVTVAGEHAVSAATLRWLAGQYQAAARDDRRPQVVVALPPGSRHEFGALAHAVALRRDGTDALYLGADLPVEDLVEAVAATGARVLVLGAVTAGDVPAAKRVAVAVREASSGVRLAFGGAHAEALAAYGTVLPASLSASASAVRELI